MEGDGSASACPVEDWRSSVDVLADAVSKTGRWEFSYAFNDEDTPQLLAGFHAVHDTGACGTDRCRLELIDKMFVDNARCWFFSSHCLNI